MGEIWGRIRQLCACRERERPDSRGEPPNEFGYCYTHIRIDSSPPAVAVNNTNASTLRLGKSTEPIDSDPRFAQWSLLSWSQRNLLGRHLITQLDTERRRRERRTPVYICWDHLVDKLQPHDHDYHSLKMRRRNWFGETSTPEEEADRVRLMQLASFAPIVKILESTIDAAMKIMKPADLSTRNLWHQHLQSERDELMSFFESLLKDNARLMGAIKEEDAQLEVLTWIKHSFDLHSDALTPREMDVISATFDRVVQLSGVVLGSLPEWFAISADKWDKAHVSIVTGGEEKCLRTVAIWIELNHPNIRKLFGSCHVGQRIFIHEGTTAVLAAGGMFSWERMLDFAHGLEYLHDRGLVHTDLSIKDFHLSTVSETQCGKGVLSGIKLIRVQECEKRMLYVFNGDLEAPSHFPIEWLLRNQRRKRRTSDWVASFSTDIVSFGGVIGNLLENTRHLRRIKILSPSLAEMQRDTQKTIAEALRENPPTQPEFVADDEFKLLLGMYAASKETMTTAHVVYQIRVLSQTEASITSSKIVEDGSIGDIKLYKFQGERLSDMLDEAGRLCSSLKELESINRPILERLLEIHSQFIKGPQRKRLIEDFSLILSRFLGSMDDRCFASQTASICASRTIAGKNYSLHHDIDRLLLGDSVLNKTAPVHTWQPRWELCRQQQIARLRGCVKNPRAFMGDLENEGDRRQAIASLAFESRIYGGASLNPTDQAKSDEFNDADVLPKWFIPAHQVELSNHLADGAFGAVYQGRWLDTDVVIKQVLTDQNQGEFRREVDLWFSLNHDYLIKLYGACHEGRAFFVCEQATHGTLVTYANGKPRLKIWECIYEAALGLKYLHERGIVHGDLKGNNILVCEDGVKLADFGLSFIAHHPDAVAGANGALGAYRWKAPECLAGSQPTFASDVYSFGMCIIEVLSGEWPWGKSMPDSAVISNVMEKKLPQQPQTIDSAEWKLISSMCCFDTDRRIIADVVVSYAFNQCRGLESWRWEYLTQ